MNLNRRLALLAATAAAVFAAGAGDALADVQCSAANGVLDVTITQGGVNTASISRTPLGQQPAYVLVNGVPCDKTTLAAATKIDVTDISGGDAVAELDQGKGMLIHPDASEIPIHFDGGGDGGVDKLIVRGGALEDHIRIGADGINLNDNEPAPDVDITFTGVRLVNVQGQAGDDHITATGGFATGNAYHDTLWLDGGSGEDFLQGGTGNDVLDGGIDNDGLYGAAGDDTLTGGPGDDTLNGSDGQDEVSYYGAAFGSAGVTVDLSKVLQPQDTGQAGVDTLVGIENLYGSTGDDLLRGGDGPNSIFGDKGDDDIDPGKGNDVVFSEEGADVVATLDGESDLIDCGDETDTVNGDPGDSAYDCETANLGQSNGGGQQGGGQQGAGQQGAGQQGGGQQGAGQQGAGQQGAGQQGGGQQGGGPIVEPPHRATTLSLVALAHQRLATVRRHGLRVKATCSAACTVHGELRMSKRLGGLGTHTLRAGTPVTLTLKLDKKARRSLAKRRHATLTAVLTGRDTTGHPLTRRLKVRL